MTRMDKINRAEFLDSLIHAIGYRNDAARFPLSMELRALEREIGFLTDAEIELVCSDWYLDDQYAQVDAALAKLNLTRI